MSMDEILEAIESWGVMRFFPTQGKALLAIGEALDEWATGFRGTPGRRPLTRDEQIVDFIHLVSRRFDDWPGLATLKQQWDDRYPKPNEWEDRPHGEAEQDS